MHTLRLTLLALIVAAGLAPRATAAAENAADVRQDLIERYSRIGRAFDQGYYDAGRRVDIVAYDLAELQRQGQRVDPALLAEVHETNRALRRAFVELDAVRADLHERIVALPPAGDYVLEFEVIADPKQGRPWFGVHAATVVLPDGATVEVAPSGFQNGAFRRRYHYLVPPRDAVFVYGRPSPTHTMQAGFDVAGRVADGAGELRLTGLDDLKPGATPIAIRLNGVEVFRGEQTFADDDWLTRTFPIPAEAFAADAPSVAHAKVLRDELAAFAERVEAFSQQAGQQADGVVDRTAELREGLVYQPLALGDDFWANHFVRGVCLSMYSQEEEHHVKAMHAIGVNMLYSYAGRYSPLDQLPELLRWTRELGIPVFQNAPDLKHTSRESLRIGKPRELVASVRTYLHDAAAGTGVRLNLAADEPNFRDELVAQPEVREAFYRYLAEHHEAFAAAGVDLPERPEELPPAYGAGEQRVLWMAWQLFRRDGLAAHFAALWDGLREDGVTPFTIIQQHLEREPQLAAYSSMGAALPLVSTDVYRDGAFVEAVAVQLLNHATDGTAVFTAGSGYSAKTPHTLRRSMAIAMTHADGLLEWTDLYLAKYRDPKAFWRSPIDDRGRSVLANWSPAYWDVTQAMYGQMREADAYLGHAESLAKVAILLSERSLIARSHDVPKAIFDGVVSTYANLVRRSVPVDVRLVESTTPEELARYEAVLLVDGRVLTADEEEALRDYAASGGTLIASGSSTLADAWGRPRSDFGLADVLGVHAAQRIDGKTPAVTAIEPVPSAKVLATAGEQPLLVSHTFGSGAAYYVATQHPTHSQAVVAADGDHTSLDDLVLDLVLAAQGTPAVALTEAVPGLEVQVRRKGETLVVHLLDWHDEARPLGPLELDVHVPGVWRAIDPSRPGHPQLEMNDGRVRIPAFEGYQVMALVPVQSVVSE